MLSDAQRRDQGEEPEADSAAGAPADRGLLTSRLARVVLDTISEGVVVRDASGALLSANPAALELLGLTRAQLAGVQPPPDGWYALGGDGSSPYGERIGPEVIRTGRPVRNRIGTIGRPDREGLTWLSMSAVPLDLVDARGCVITFRDITTERAVRERELDQQAAEGERREIERQMTEALHDRDLILRHSPVGIAKARGRQLVWINRRWEEIFGYAVDEVVGKSSRIFYPDDESFDAAGRLIFPALERDGHCRLEVEMQRKDGSRFLASFSGGILGPFADARESLWTVEDITERRRNEVALRESEQRLQTIFAALDEGVIVFGADGSIIASNEAAERILGEPPVEYMARVVEGAETWMTHDDGRPLAVEEQPAVVSFVTGLPSSGIILGIRRSDGESRWVSASSEPLVRAPGEKPHAVVAGFIDITEIRRDREEIRRQATELREALDKVRTLSGLIPICAYCHKIRNDQGYWDRLEEYLIAHTDAVLSHGMCPDCYGRYAAAEDARDAE